MIDSWVHNEQPVDLDTLKVKAKEMLADANSNSKNLRVVEKDDLSQLWSKYVEFHQSLKIWEETYILTHIKTVTAILQRCPHQKLEQKADIFQWFLSDEKRSVKTSKARLTLVVAAIDWNSKQGNVPRKWGIEYRDLLESVRIKTAKSNAIEGEETEISIFKVAEIYNILEALKTEKYSRFKGKHYQYYKYVYFCWLTGCRPSEAIALKWKNIDFTKKRIVFAEGEVCASGKIVKKIGTKTERSRTFPINNELENLLCSLSNYSSDGYVFTSANNKPISQHALNRVWQGLLSAMSIDYRVPYQLRHTMISYHANNDFPIHKLADLVGNSEKIIKEHYYKVDIEKIKLPDVIRVD